MDFFNKFPGLKGTRVRADIWDAMTPQQRHKFILTSDGPDGLVVAVDDGAAK